MGNSPLQQIVILEGVLAETEARLKEAEQALENINCECVIAPKPSLTWISEKCAETLAKIRGER